MRILVALLLWCSAPALFAAAPARQIEATYEVNTRGIKIALITEKFTRTGNRYRIVSATKPLGLLAALKPETIEVTSEGEVTAHGLRPRTYTYKRSKETIRNAAATFDWKKSNLELSDRQGQRSIPLPPETQDRLSVLYQFPYVHLLNQRKELTMQITNGSKIDTRRYLIKAGQTLTTPMGALEALYLSTPPEATAWKTEIWLSVKNGNFPCKIILTEDNGDQLTQVLTALSIAQ
jgi:hypothetical protein